MQLQEALNQSEKLVLLILPSLDFLTLGKQSPDDDLLSQQFNALLAHPHCRLMAFSNNLAATNRLLPSQFATVHLAKPTESDINNLLKLKREELENYHHIVIPEELLNYAYSLSERYLSTDHALDKTLLLLDSSAARASIIERNEHPQITKPILTLSTITTVLSSLTQIPAANLALNKFKFSEFMQQMQQKVSGQDAAINLLAHQLQQAQAHLQQHVGPFCSLLFAGPEHSGKKTMITALVDQLFKQPQALYFAETAGKSPTSIIDLKLNCHLDKHTVVLKDLIQQIPYAIIVFENIDEASSILLDGLHDILSTGYLHDAHGNTINFRQAIIILTTTRGTLPLNDIAKTFVPAEETQHADLLQLVMSEKKPDAFLGKENSPQDIAKTIMNEMTNILPRSLCQYLAVIPFLPLNKTAIEKIIRIKLKQLGVSLDSRYGVEIGYAPEVIRYLAADILKNDSKASDIDKSLRQLYFAVEQAVLNQSDNKNRSNQLFLQLNETGQILRCDWLAASSIRQHAT